MDLWEETGGATGRLVLVGGVLVETGSSDPQEEVGSFFRMHREPPPTYTRWMAYGAPFVYIY